MNATAKTHTRPFDAAEVLDTPEAIATYLADAYESGDADVFQDALQTAARARGMTEIAEDAGLGRESLYKALRPGAKPRFDTVRKVTNALGLQMTFVATSKKNPRIASGSALTPSKAPVRGGKGKPAKQVRKEHDLAIPA